jgi:hypothetical protein
MNKQINWYEKDINEVYDVLYNKTDNQEERFGFFKHLIQNYPELDIDWLEIFEDLREDLFKKEKIDEVLFFVDWYSNKFEEDYKNRYEFIECDLCNYYLFKKDFKSLHKRIEFIQQNPVPGIDVVTKRLLYQLIYFGKYQLAISYAENVWKPIDQAESLMGYAAYDFINTIYISNFQKYHEALLNNVPFDTNNLFKKAVALGFDDDQNLFDEILIGIKSDIDTELIVSSIAKGEIKHMLHLNIQFLKYMYKEYKLPFVFSELLWQFVATLKIFGKYGDENWFFIDAKTMDKHIASSYDFFLGNNEIEVFGKVWGLQYLTSFFYSKNLISDEQFQTMSENNMYFINSLLKTVGINAWQMLFVFDWPKIKNQKTIELDAAQLEKTYSVSYSDKNFEFAEYISTFLENDRITNEIAENEKRTPLFPEFEHEQPYVKKEKDIGRNEPCPCGSGKKYKKCCLNI